MVFPLKSYRCGSCISTVINLQDTWHTFGAVNVGRCNVHFVTSTIQ